jgi:TolA-binding protein
MRYTWLVEKYLEGELSGEALRKFELEILRKREVAEEVERVRSMHHFMIEQHGKLQDSIGLIEDFEDSENVIDEETIRRDLDGLKVRRISNGQKDVIDLETKLTESKVSHTLSNQKSNKVLVRKVSVWLAAASIAILMVTSISLVTGKGGSGDYMALYQQYYSAYPADINNRSTAQGFKDSYDKALDAYDQKNYKSAYQYFEKIPEEFDPEDRYYLYKGVTAMELGEFQVAIKSFSNLQSDATLKHYGMWYTGLSCIALENIPAARKVLEDIISTDGYYKREAKKLLRKI